MKVDKLGKCKRSEVERDGDMLAERPHDADESDFPGFRMSDPEDPELDMHGVDSNLSS